MSISEEHNRLKKKFDQLQKEHDRLLHQADLRLSRSEERYRRLVENLQNDYFFYCHDTQGKITYVSPSVKPILGYSPEEFLSHYTTYFTDNPKNQIAVKYTELSIQGKPTPRYEIEVRKKDGTISYQEIKDSPVFDEEGKVIAVEGISRDITAWRNLEQELTYRLRFERLITSIAGDFLRLPYEEIDKGISDALKRIGEFVGADRSYIFRYYDNERKQDMLYEYCAPGIESKFSLVQGKDLNQELYYAQKMRNHQIFYLAKRSDLPDDQHVTLHNLKVQDVRSLIIVPMVMGGKLAGSLGFDAVRKEREWSDNTINLLKIVSEIFGSAIQRRETESRLKNSIEEKEILLKEVHHRVKNNLAMVDSLIQLSSNRVKEEEDLEVLRSLRGRIRSISLVHEQLYKSKDFGNIDAREYFSDLLGNMESTFGSYDHIQLEFNLDPVLLRTDTIIPLGFITHELVTNGYRYAFPAGTHGRITVTLKQLHAGALMLSVCDNGIGIPGEINPSGTGTIGLQLVRALVDQLHGTLKTVPAEGCRFEITVPL